MAERRRLLEGGRLLEGKVGLVTGGASGIGRATCEAFAREGARVMVGDLDARGAEETARAICDAGGEAESRSVDVTREDQVEALVAAAVERFGRLDCALNNAGISGTAGPLQQIALEDFRRTLDVNLVGVFLCMKHEIRAMQGQGSGAIVNTASGAGVIATPALSPYCASKHGILGLTKTAALENARTGIRINAVLPGSTDTPMLRASMGDNPEIEKLVLRGQPGGRLGRPEEIAEAVVWLCSDRASFVTGDSMLVDGGAVAR
jgi:NAD(P)-dependent dehydrogenase (short-subunit alcohol dehydrogenase family)